LSALAVFARIYSPEVFCVQGRPAYVCMCVYYSINKLETLLYPSRLISMGIVLSEFSLLPPPLPSKRQRPAPFHLCAGPHALFSAVFKLAVFVDISTQPLKYFIIIPMEAYTEQWLIFKEEIANFQQRARESCASLLKCKSCL
jgi:hypothetical protein